MARNKRKLTANGDLVVSTIPGKLIQITTALSGDNIYVLHNGADGAAPIIYKVDVGEPIPHQNLNIPFKQLFCDKLSGAGGDINILFE